MNQLRIQMIQLNNAYGNRFYVPYSIGMLAAYARMDPAVDGAYDFLPFLYRRTDPAAAVAAVGCVDVLAISCYVWNFRLSMAIAMGVRAANPDCLIIVGGPHVPDRLDDFFERHPFLDIACHGEAELTFTDILRQHANGGDLSQIAGLSFHDRHSQTVTQNPKRARITDLDTLPSPYLAGLFDSLMDAAEPGTEWMVMWETNRGCPFSCTFCDWGSATRTKIRNFSMDRLADEIRWFGEKRIVWVFGCDANFGILKRDLEVAQTLADTKAEMGYPLEFRVCYTKNSNDRAYNVAKLLHDADMSKGVSLSMQSLNPDTLKSIRRGNIRLDVFHKLQARYQEEEMATFTELIIALPGETYDSFVAGIERLLENGQHSQINIYNCSMMPNAEMADPAYREKHGIETVELPIFQAHSAPPGSDDTVREYEPIVVATNSLSRADWRRTYHFAWVVQCFHLLGITRDIAVFLHYDRGIGYSEFYHGILSLSQSNGLIARELAALDALLDRVLAGVGFDQYLPDFYNISWPAEEASFLRFSDQIEDLYKEIEPLIQGFVDNPDLCSDLVRYQHSVLVNHQRRGDRRLELGWNLYEYIRGFRIGKPIALEAGPHNYNVIDNRRLAGSRERFAREVVWFGRKGGKYTYPLEPLAL